MRHEGSVKLATLDSSKSGVAHDNTTIGEDTIGEDDDTTCETEGYNTEDGNATYETWPIILSATKSGATESPHQHWRQTTP